MSLPDMNAWERKPGWVQIVESIRCRMCGAEAGKKCRDLSVGFGVIAGDRPRMDYHQVRKYDAIQEYENRNTIEAK